MKAGKWLMVGGVLVGAYVLFKLVNRASDPTVTSIARSTYGNTQQVNGLISSATQGLAASIGKLFGGSSNTGSAPALQAGVPTDNTDVFGDSSIGYETGADYTNTDNYGLFA